MRERGDAHREGSVDSEGVKRFLIDFAFVHPSLSLELSRQLDPDLMQGGMGGTSRRMKVVAFPPSSVATYGKMITAPNEGKFTDDVAASVLGRSIWEEARVPLELRSSRVPVRYIVTRTGSS